MDTDVRVEDISRIEGASDGRSITEQSSHNILPEHGKEGDQADIRAVAQELNAVHGEEEKYIGDLSSRSKEDTKFQLSLELSYRFIKKRNTLYSKLLSPRVLRSMYRWVWNNRFVMFATYLSWVLLSVAGFLLLNDVKLIPDWIYVPFQIGFIIFFNSCHFAFINLDILKDVLVSFNFLFLLLHASLVGVNLAMLWNWNFSIIIVGTHVFSSCLYIILIDSYMFSKPTLMKLVCIFGVITLSSVFCIIKFVVGVRSENEKSTLSLQDRIILDLKLQIADSLSVLIIYFLRVLVFKFFREPKSLTLLESNYNIIPTPKLSTNDALSPFPSISGTSNKNESRSSKSIAKIHPFSERDGTSSSAFLPVAPEVKRRAGLNGGPNETSSMPTEVRNNPRDYLIFGIYNKEVTHIDNQNTIYHHYLHKKIPFVKKLMKSKIYMLYGVITNVGSSVLCLLVLFWSDFGSMGQITFVAWVSLSIANLITQIILTSNLAMVRKMVMSFDYWYVTALNIQAIMGMYVLLDFDWRFIVWIWFFVAAQWYVFIDSFPLRMKKLTLYSIIGIILSLSVSILCRFDLGPAFQDNPSIYLFDIEVINAKNTISGSLFSWCIFMIRFLVGYLRNPTRSQFATSKLFAIPVHSVIEQENIP